MTWRRLRPGEIDHEALWLGVSVAAFLGAWTWLYLALPVPHCAFHRLSGLPCPTCGMTRCLRYAVHHDWWNAVRMNPLAFAGYGAAVLYDLYAAVVLLFSFPRLRFEHVSPRWSQFVRYSAITAILGNWAWLVWMKI